MLRIVWLLAVSFAVEAVAATLEPVGVIGNSGGLHTTIDRTGGGVVVDARGRICCGGGDRIVVLNRDGRRLWEYALPQPDWVLGGPGFAVVGDQLYFVAGKPDDRPPEGWDLRPGPRAVVPNVCRVRMLPEARAELVVATDKLGWEYPSANGWLSLGTADEELILGYRLAGKPYTVARIAPDGTLTPLFEDAKANWMSVDEAGHFYLGSGERVVKVDRRGQLVPGFAPSKPPYLGAVPTALQGQVMLTRDAIWDSGPYGFVARFDRQYRSAPGVVVQNQLLLHRVNQVCDAPGGGYYIQSHDTVYEADIAESQLRLRRRFGSLPEVSALVVTRQGYVGVGNAHCAMMWFDFERDDPAAAPLKTFWPPSSQGWYDGELAMKAYDSSAGRLGLGHYAAEPFIDPGGYEQHFRPSELRITAATRVGNFVFAMERAGQILWRAAASEPTNLIPAGRTTDWLPAAATSLATLGTNTLALAGGGKIVALAGGADGALSRQWELAGNGREPFGPALYVSASAGQLLVADTERNRLVLFRIEPPGASPVTEFTDGLSRPTLVALEGARAAVYDSGHQRVIKFRLR